MDTDSRLEVKLDAAYAPGSAQVSPPAPLLAQQELRAILVSFMGGCGLDARASNTLSDEVTSASGAGVRTDQLGDLLLRIIARCLGGAAPTAYLSVPITTGRAYLQWRSRRQDGDLGDETDLRADVVAANLRRANHAVSRLRATMQANVIDPSRLPDIPGWAQADYHAFWSQVVGLYPQQMIFLDQWQYSVGCTREFADAIRIGLPTFTEHLSVLDADTGVRLVRSALHEYDEARVDSASLRTSLKAIQTALGKPTSTRSPA